MQQSMMASLRKLVIDVVINYDVSNDRPTEEADLLELFNTVVHQ